MFMKFACKRARLSLLCGHCPRHCIYFYDAEEVKENNCLICTKRNLIAELTSTIYTKAKVTYLEKNYLNDEMFKRSVLIHLFFTV